MYIQPDYGALLPFSFKSEKAMFGYEVLKKIKAFSKYHAYKLRTFRNGME